MNIAIIGTGFIGTTLGRPLSEGDHSVTFGSRNPARDRIDGVPAQVASVGDALARSEVVILALPGAAVADLALEHGPALDGKLVIDATNKMGDEVPNSRSALPSTVRYARAFNTLGGENIADPVFADGRLTCSSLGQKATAPCLKALSRVWVSDPYM